LYIDSDLIKLPLASPMQRVSAYLIDRVLLILVPILSGLAVSPIYLLTFIGVPNVAASIFIIAGVVIGFLYITLWGNWIRVGNNGQTFGMTIAKIAIASDPTPIENSFFNKVFFFTRIDRTPFDKRWMGDEEEERIDAQLWRGLAPYVFFPVILILVFIVTEIIGRIPLVLISLFSGDFNLMASNNIVTYSIGVLLIAYFLLILFGNLLALTKQRRTLVDHFLGIKFVNVSKSNLIKSKITFI